MKVFFPILKLFLKNEVWQQTFYQCATLTSLSLVLFYLRWLSLINKLNTDVRSMPGQDPPVMEITGKIIETIKRKKM